MSNKPQAVIFDFDGTIADSVPIIRVIYTELAVKNKWKVMTDQDYDILRRGSLRDARRWSGIRFWQLPMVIRSARKLMKVEAEKVTLFPGVFQLLKELRSQEIDLYVLSRNSSDTIEKVLERYSLQNDLRILARRRSFGSKGAVIKWLLNQKTYDRNKVWMVGDEVRDILAANSAGTKSVAVSWGIQDISILKKHQPTHSVVNVEELRQILLA